MTKLNELAKEVENLINKASRAEKSDDALKFSQAACNAINAMRTMHELKIKED